VKSVYKNFSKHFLVAIPHIRADFFKENVIYLLEHKLQGTCGLAVNRFSQFKSLHLTYLIKRQKNPVFNNSILNEFRYFYGQFYCNRTFLLHEYKISYKHIVIFGEVALIPFCGVFFYIADGKNLIILGCAKWQSGQLEQVKTGLCFTYPANNNVAFKVPAKFSKRKYILNKININIDNFNFSVGRA